MHEESATIATKAAHQLQIPGSYIPFLRPSRHSMPSYVVRPKAGTSPFPRRHYATPFLEALDCYGSQWKVTKSYVLTAVLSILARKVSEKVTVNK